jgi:N-acetylglucosaminyl-diphospho-decaprenol L-rhamnosyltransferase
VLDRAIERLAEFARGHPAYGLYGGRALRRDGSLEPTTCFELPTVWSMACFALGLTTLFRSSRLFNPEAIPGWNRDTVREVGMLSGCLLLVPRELWRTMKGFDERYFMYSEDADLALRVRRMGYRPVVFPGARIIHDLGKASATRADKLMLVLLGRATYLRDHFQGWRRGFVLSALVAGVGLRALLSKIAMLFGSRSDSWQFAWAKRKAWIRGYA